MARSNSLLASRSPVLRLAIFLGDDFAIYFQLADVLKRPTASSYAAYNVHFRWIEDRFWKVGLKLDSSSLNQQVRALGCDKKNAPR